MSTLRRRRASSASASSPSASAPSASVPSASSPSASASSPSSPSASSSASPTQPRAYILENTITHARLLPHPATHAFSYPTLALLLPLAALEAGALDLGRGWVFGYRAERGGGGQGWGSGWLQWRVTGVRAGAYLLPDGVREPEEGEGEDDGESRAGKGENDHGLGTGSGPLKGKLAAVLLQQGRDRARVRAWAAGGDAWMLTMPSYLGYEGINPLTVYFCYARGGALAWVVLEIHNTFGEKHVHVLEPGTREDSDGPCSYDHTWTLPRDFHVSPFNDRAGFYTISIAAPPAPSSPLLLTTPPRPKVRIHLRTPSTPSSSSPSDPTPTIIPDKLKLTATLFTRRATPLTTPNLLRTLARHPFALLLSLARILYHAWILHYLKRLPVFPRPDPKPAAPGWYTLSPSSTPSSASLHPADERTFGGIGWQPEGALEAYARRRLSAHLTQRGARVLLVSGDPSVPRQLFGEPSDDCERPVLTIHYTAPRFFSTLVLAPSAEHALLMARAEDLFRTSSDALFCTVLSRPGLGTGRPVSGKANLAQRVRVALLPARFVTAVAGGCPPTHPLDGGRPLLNVLVICALHLLDQLERAVFALLRARFVPGMEPWLRWDRAADLAERKTL